MEAIMRLSQEEVVKVSNEYLKGIQPRLYQQTIFASAASKNSLVILPTGLGKTLVAMMLAAHRLKTHPHSKIIFMAPTKPLVEQHLKTFKDSFNIPEDELCIFTGATKPEKRALLFEEKKLIFSTPQGLENDILTSRINLADVSLLIFDEAHKAVGDYAYTFIAKQYMKKALYPQMLALTASPGANMEKIMEVCENLYIENVEVRTDKDPDVIPYLQEVDIRWHKVFLPDEFIAIQKLLKECIAGRLKEIKNNGYLHESKMQQMSKTDMLRLQGQLHAAIAQGERTPEIFAAISLCVQATKTEHALELLESQGLTALHHYFLKVESEADKTKAAKNLLGDFNFKTAMLKTEKLVENGVEHPKITALRELIGKETQGKKDIKVIIFNQFRDTASDIVKQLSGFCSAKLFVGQANKKDKGLTQKEQKAMLDEFRNGEFQVLVATSVAEEGLDIPSVDLVVFYEPVASAIRTIQRRGRTGRQSAGRVTVLMAAGTRDEGYRWAAHHKEKKMYRTLDTLKSKFKLEQSRSQDLSRFMTKEKELVIFADHREKSRGALKELVNKEVRISLSALESADYILSKDVGVEFKTAEDFVDSILDKRLFEQLGKLKKQFSKPLLLVEGEHIYTCRNVHMNAINGALSCAFLDFGIPVLFTRNSQETAALFLTIAKREQESSDNGYTPHSTYKPQTVKESQEYIVASVPGIGPQLSKQLLEKFGSIRNVFSAPPADLKQVLGEKKGEGMQKLLDEWYKKN